MEYKSKHCPQSEHKNSLHLSEVPDVAREIFATADTCNIVATGIVEVVKLL
jgi:hypothetical protein